MSHCGAWHEVRELRRARRARALREDAMHERGAPVDTAERAPEHDADAVSRRLRLVQRVLHGDRSETGRPVEATGPCRIEERIGIDAGTRIEAALGERRALVRSEAPARPEDRGAGHDHASASGRSLRLLGRARRVRRGGCRAAAVTRRLREHEHRVHAPEPERVRERGANARHFSTRAEHVKQTESGIWLVETARRHDRASRHHERRDGGFDRAGRAERVPDLPLAARDGHATNLGPEGPRQRGPLPCGQLAKCPVPCAFHVVDIPRGQTRIARGLARSARPRPAPSGSRFT